MNCCIVTIGDELVDGFSIDTNSSWISKQLFEYKKIIIKDKISIRDNPSIIEKTFNYLSNEKYNYVFVTGGLGPTHDDVTKLAILNLLGSKFLFDEEYYLHLIQRMKSRKIKISKKHKSQAQCIKGTTIFPNPLGSARGIRFVFGKTVFYIFPGVPNEMKKMFCNEVLEKEFNNYLKEKKIVTINTFGIYETAISDLLSSNIKIKKNIYSFSFLPSYYGVKVRIKKMGNVKSGELIDFSKKIFSILQPYSYSYGKKDLSQVAVEKIILANKTISIAESCTGGYLSKIITDIPGSSKVLIGSVVAYSDYSKIKFLGIKSNFIKKHGAVSMEVAKKMAIQIMKINQSDLSVAITGISGPGGGSLDKPVGLVYIACKFHSNLVAKEYVLKFDRLINRKITIFLALNMIRLMLDEN